MPRRRRLLAGLGGFFGVALAGSAYALEIEPGLRLEVRHHRPTPPGWPAGFRLRVGVLTGADGYAVLVQYAREGRIGRILGAAKGPGL